MLRLFMAAFALGMILNVAPGAVFTESIRRGMGGGFRTALAVQIGSLIGDALWAVLGLLGVGLVFQLEWVRFPLGIAGAGYLIWLARDAWRAANRMIDVSAETRVPPGSSAFRAGALLSVTNPQNVAYWAAIGSALGGLGIQHPTAAQYATYFAGFMTASVAWCFLCAALVHHLFGRARGPWVKLTYRACAIAFLALAVSTLREAWDHRPRGGAHRWHQPLRPRPPGTTASSPLGPG